MEPNHTEISLLRQCDLLDISRSTLYYRCAQVSELNDLLMRLIDKQYTAAPFYGVPRMTAWLRAEGYPVNPKRVRRLMRLMNLYAVYPKPRTSVAAQTDKKYPYLLKGLDIKWANAVWCIDITYIRMRKGYVYLVAIMDWFSRYVLSWELSKTLESGFCVTALQRSLMDAQPLIFNSDQGAQFTSLVFAGELEKLGVRISMVGRGRCFDNILVERLWRTVKYEEVYMKEYEDIESAVANLGGYFNFYNNERLHQSLGYQTPSKVYWDSCNAQLAEDSS